MPEFLSGKRIIDEILASLSGTERVDFAVAYWGHGATETLGLDKINKPVRILCDLSRLSCNPDELQKFLDRGFKLKTKTGFHAKVYITSKKLVVGSANASTNGLGDLEDEIESELEAAVMTSNERAMEAAVAWFKRHWDDSDAVEVTKPLLDQIRQLWESRPKSPTLLSLLVNSPELFVRMPIRLVVFEDRRGEYERAWVEIKKARFYTDDEIRRYEGWDPFYLDHSSRWGLKDGEYVVSFWAKKTNRTRSYELTSAGAFWRYKKTEWVLINGKKTKVLLADRMNIIAGLRFPDADYAILKKCMRNYFRQNKSAKLKPPILLDVRLGDLRKFYPSIFTDLKTKIAAK